MRIEVATVRSGDTPATLAAKMVPSDQQENQFLVLNGLDPGTSLAAGDRVKIVAQ